MGKLTGKTALVTGASRGIGRAIALRLAKDGARLVLHYARSADAASALAEEIAGFGVQPVLVSADLSDISNIDAVVSQIEDKIGGGEVLDILVNNAGHLLPDGPEASEASFDGLVAVNLKAPFFLIQKLSARMKSGGRIVNVSSGLSKMALPSAMLYGMTKAGLNHLTLSFAKEFGPRGINVNAVLPGIIRSDMSAWVGSEEGARIASARSVFGRVGEPADVADIVAFLASDDSRWVTGECIDASGGQFLV
jgi:NAD(P)-dependent dehydrogenase (short-subunit alcohol dehydrogenase family)